MSGDENMTAMNEISILDGVNGILLNRLKQISEEQLAALCLSVVENITGSRYGFIAEIKKNGYFDILAVSNSKWDTSWVVNQAGIKKTPVYLKIQGLYRRMFEKGESFFTNDPASHPDNIDLPTGHPPLSSFLGVPLFKENEIFGMLAVGNREGGYTHKELQSLEMLAPTIVEALQSKRAEEDVARSKRKVSEILESIQDGFYAIDRNWCFTYMNHRAAEHFGLKPEDLIGKYVWDKFPRFFGTEHEQHIRKAMNIREIQRYEGPDVYTDKWLSISIYPSDEGVSLFWQDISERKQAEESLRESEARFRIFMDNSPVISWVKDEHGRYIYLNKTYEERFGVKLENLKGKTDFELWPTEIASAFWESDQKVLAEGRAIEVTEVATNPDGVLSDWLNCKFPLRDKAGKQFICAMGMDITQRKRAEEESALSKRKVTEILESVQDGFHAIDRNWRFMYMNQRAADHLGFKAADFIGENIWEKFPLILGTAHEAHMRKAMETREIQRYEGPDIFTENRWFSISIYPSDEGLSIYWQDITERKQMEKALVFFREATLRMQSTLDIEKALWDCFMYIRNFIPADIMFLHLIDQTTGTGEIVAEVDVAGGKITSRRMTFPSESYELLVEKSKETGLVTTDCVSKDPLLCPMTSFFKSPNSAVMAMKAAPLGDVALGIHIGNSAGEKYSEEHIKLFSMLNESFSIAISNYLRFREVSRLKNILEEDNRYLQTELLEQKTPKEMVGAESGMKQVMKMVRQVAPLSSPVLLLGETGVGKEVVATAIHNNSLRWKGPLIKVNCGAIPETLMDSELFGYEKGAYTGALHRQQGRFERANSGTIFLDEVGALTPNIQARLLRVLQEHEIERLGGTKVIPVDIRVIAATNVNLEVLIGEGKFREDLYFRLNVFPILIPPLKDRRTDIPMLVQHFILNNVKEMKLSVVPVLAPGEIDKLMQYHWPGNVRELKNEVERAIIVSEGKPLVFADLGAFSKIGDFSMDAVKTILPTDRGGIQSLDQAMSQHIIHALEMTKGRISGEKGAAKYLKMNPSTLRAKMRKLGIESGRVKRSP